MLNRRRCEVAKRPTVNALLACSVAILLVAQTRPGRAAPDQPDGPATPQEIEEFLDPLFADQMRRYQVPGAVFVLVKDGETFFAKGYGLADIQRHVSVDPERSIFYLASVTKLFTATAVMQLVEAGRLNLNDDVNRYLKEFQIQRKYGEPVTTVHLLTHTAGFDERTIGFYARTEQELTPLGRYLAENMPARVMPPGRTVSYSNHGMALAGFLVETLSDMSCPRYVEQHILRPLGMKHSGFMFPPPPELAADMVVGYRYPRPHYPPAFMGYRRGLPAGGLWASGGDMARFMICHLQRGEFQGVRVLKDETAREMHRQHTTHHPAMPGRAPGFSEHTINGQRALAHGGGFPGFTTLVLLLPDHNLGFFAAINRQESGFQVDLATAFLDRFFPGKNPTLQKVADSPENRFGSLRRLVGTYRFNRYARHTLEKLIALDFEAEVTVSLNNTLLLRDPVSDELSQWEQLGPLLFREVGGEELIAFGENEKGRVTHLFLDRFSAGGSLAFERLAWYEIARLQMVALAASFLICLSSVVVWPTSYLIRLLRRRKLPLAPLDVSEHARRLTSIFMAVLNVVFAIGLMAALEDPVELVFGIPLELKATLCLPLLSCLSCAALAVLIIATWKWSRVYDVLVLLGGTVFLVVLNYWNLLGFRY